MKNLDEKEMSVEMKSRVKVNIYKTLLEEEKQKNKRNSTIGVSLFIVGIVSTTALYQLKDQDQPQQVNRVQGLVQNVGNRNNDRSSIENKNQSAMDLFNGNVIENKVKTNVKEEDFFVSDFKM